MKKTIKLVNNERLNTNIQAAKACDITSVDICSIIDNSGCMVYAYDVCGKDYKSCSEGADDYCSYIDNNTPCVGAGQIDGIRPQ